MRRTPLATLPITVALLGTSLVACGSTADPALPGTAMRGVAGPALPDPVPAIPAFKVRLRSPVHDLPRRKLGRLDGIAVVAPVNVVKREVRLDGYRTKARVASVEPLSFRSVVPPQTRDAGFVWTALVSGRAVVTPRFASRAQLEGSVSLRRRDIEVGAFADNGTPNIADVIVADHVGTELGLASTELLFIGVTTKADLDRVRRRLRAALGRRIASIDPLVAAEAPAAPETPVPVGRVEGGLIGTMNFQVLRGGFIRPDPAWVAANIATGTVPILGRVTCHRAVFPQLGSALAEIQRRGLAGKIDPGDYEGCYVPRFIDRDPRRGLSMHAFGLALDLNVSENYLGTKGKMDPRIVEIFERWGFEWGGRWTPRPDPMHFELDRLISG